jgi:signal transduction histidine kinase
MIGVVQDITDRKKAEKELQQAKDELELRVQERTASLQETTEQLETFCYTVAHDLRSPLRAQQSFAQVLLDDYKNSLDEMGQEYARRILGAAARLDKLVNDLLTYSRLSRSELKFEKVSLDKVFSDVQTALHDDIQRNAALVTVQPLHFVRAYEPTLNLVLTNLLTNALKFVEPGAEPRVQIWSEQHGNIIRLWVADNGIGISPENADKIFGVFQRLHPINKYPGTGIGLAIVQKAVTRMGGQVGVESELEKGSRFWIELPAA